MPDGRLERGYEDVDVLEGGLEPPRWRQRWAALPTMGRRLVAALGVVMLVGAALAWSRERSAERERAERVELAVSLSVFSSSTSPPGGRVSWFVVVRNEGERPVTLTAVTGGDDGVRLRMLDDDERTVPPGAELSIPLSVRLTCSDAEPGAGPLPAELVLRRADGGPATRRVALEPAVLVRVPAGTLCSVRPDLRDYELSGRVLRGIAAKGDIDG